ncbi:MAG: TonB-dependent receptor [Sulfuritalea sp.]|nr:TonB-dependent receptor [Sulfuritalea sp.]
MNTIHGRAARRSLFRISLMAAALAAANPSLAADEATVLVTGSRFAGKPSHTVTGTSVITAAAIAQSSATSVPEILAKLGGVHVRNSSGSTNWQIDLRGFGMSGDQNTLILLDGRRLSENELTPALLSSVPLNAIDRIEILRGSGAVLYGGGATAGTINIITRNPASEGRLTSIRAAYGDYGTSDVRATVELASGAVGMLLHANRYVSSNYRVNNHDREDKLEGVVRWHDADASATLRFGSSRQKMRFPGARSTVQIASDPAGSATQNDHGLTDAWNVGVSVTRSAGIGEFAIDIDYRNKKADNKFPALFAANATDSDTVTVSPRLRIPHQNGSLLVGIDSTRWTYSNIDLFGLANANQTIDALYAQETWTPLPGTDISAGIRTSFYKDSFSRPAVASRRDTLNAFELSLRQRLVGGFDAYGSWGQSFRVATANENYNVFTGTVTLLLPQKSHDGEVGVEFRNRSTRVRAAAFASYLTNEIHLLVLNGTPTFGFGANSNLAPTQRTGFELEGSWHPLAELSLSAIYQHTRATFRSGTYDGIDLAGKEVPLVPSQLLTLNAAWRIGNGHNLAANLRFVGSQRYDNDQINSFSLMPSYSLADLKYSYATGNWIFGVAADNLLNKRYYSYGIRNGAGTSFNAYPELGRRVILSAELKI